MRIGAYETLAELGRGGMGVVYRARSDDGREVALKLIVSADADALPRFERESRLQELLSTKEGFVPLLDRGTSSQGPYVVMPLLPGGTLEDRLRRGPLEVEEARALVERLATALGKAHARGIVHRDMKPGNVLYDENGQAFVADLGLAKHFRHDMPGASQSRSLTHAGTGAGTVGYMAPEQLDDMKTAGPQADVFALGAILHECLAGEKPFPARGVLEYVKQLKRGEPVDLAAVRDEVPESLASVVSRALARDPADRFEGGSALARALRDCAGEKRRGGKTAVIVGGVLLGLALAGGGTAWAVFSEDEAPAQAPSSTERPKATPGASELLAKARARLATKDLASALALCSKAIDLEPRNAQAWELRASVRQAKGETKETIADCTRAIELEPKRANAWALRGAARASREDWKGAIDDCTRAIEIDERCELAWKERGAARVITKDLENGIADLTRAIELDPQDAIARMNRYMPRMRKGDWEGAISDLDAAVRLEPRNPAFLMNRGVARAQHGDLDRALEDLDRALELDPKNIQTISARGFARRDKGDRAGAIADLHRLLELAPDCLAAPHARAALEALESVEPDPKDAEGFASRGMRRVASGDVEGGISDCDRAIALDPSCLKAFTTRASARSLERDDEGALADCTKALELDPKNAAVWLTRAAVRLQKRDFAGVVEDSSRAIELQPNMANAWAFRGGANDMLNRLDAAIADFSRAIELQPENTSYWLSRGTARMKVGENKGARADFEHFIEMKPSDAGAVEKARAALEHLK